MTNDTSNVLTERIILLFFHRQFHVFGILENDESITSETWPVKQIKTQNTRHEFVCKNVNEKLKKEKMATVTGHDWNCFFTHIFF